MRYLTRMYAAFDLFSFGALSSDTYDLSVVVKVQLACTFLLDIIWYSGPQ
jgi:hypothetical protein